MCFFCYFLTICDKCQEKSVLDIEQTSKGKERESGEVGDISQRKKTELNL